MFKDLTPKVSDLICTCAETPAQYEGNIDGRDIYIRYWGGKLEVWLATDKYGEALDGEKVLSKRLGGAYDGHIEWSEVHKHLNGMYLGEKE